MAASSGVVSETGAIPKWQIALAVGTPVVLGVGYYLYKSSKTEKKGVKPPDKTETAKKSASSESAANAATPAASPEVIFLNVFYLISVIK